MLYRLVNSKVFSRVLKWIAIKLLNVGIIDVSVYNEEGYIYCDIDVLGENIQHCHYDIY